MTPVPRLPAWRWFLPRPLRLLVTHLVLLVGLLSFGLASSMQMFVWIDSQRFGHAIGTTVTTQTITSTPTNSRATAYSNQKKDATLSVGREVVVIGATTTNAEFWWSDDGWATKTQYTAGTSDIAGWSNGSIYAYVDNPGAVERLVAIWKQSGTGGGRTDGYIYAATGTFNAGRTILTWGTVRLILGATEYNYPDVVVTAEGTGGAALFFLSYADAVPTNRVRWQQYAISGDTLGATAADGGNLTGSYGVNAHTFPSADINPSTKDVYVGLQAGTTGAGKGVRFLKLAYAAGVWTPGAEVAVDTTRYMQDSAQWVVCRWNSHDSMVVLGCGINTASAASYDLMQYESTNFTTFTTRALATGFSASACVFFGGMAIDPATGDSYFLGTNNTPSDVAYYKWTRATTTLGSRVVVDTGAATTPHVNPWYSATGPAIRWIYTSGSASPWSVKVGTLS